MARGFARAAAKEKYNLIRYLMDVKRVVCVLVRVAAFEWGREVSNLCAVVPSWLRGAREARGRGTFSCMSANFAEGLLCDGTSIRFSVGDEESANVLRLARERAKNNWQHAEVMACPMSGRSRTAARSLKRC